MGGSLPLKAGAPLRQSLAKSGEGSHQKLVNSRRFGLVIERALDLVPITNKQAAAVMGYGDNQTPLGNWIAGREHPQMDKLEMIEGFGDAFLIAYAERTRSAAVKVRTVVEVARCMRTA